LDGSIQSKIIAMAFSMAAEIERDLISQRTTEALRYKRAQGI
jgi:DNA invertase Pin-like site-specific DNA recombinase